jgi:hypothetical protein
MLTVTIRTPIATPTLPTLMLPTATITRRTNMALTITMIMATAMLSRRFHLARRI